MKSTHIAVVIRWIEMLDFASQDFTFGSGRYNRVKFWEETAERVRQHANSVRHAEEYRKQWEARHEAANA